ncbi:hypothetical protein LCGC14_2603330 [marine sediment metagenome]|uniref:Uncharacterized protein n=1 Tax=marine sediment metagenome TaxID=412755 RepID=A0A0F9CJ46_9ZZZZ
MKKAKSLKTRVAKEAKSEPKKKERKPGLVLPYYDENFGANLSSKGKRGKLILKIISSYPKMEKQKNGVKIDIKKDLGQNYVAYSILGKVRKYVQGWKKKELNIKDVIRKDVGKKVAHVTEFVANI